MFEAGVSYTTGSLNKNWLSTFLFLFGHCLPGQVWGSSYLSQPLWRCRQALQVERAASGAVVHQEHLGQGTSFLRVDRMLGVGDSPIDQTNCKSSFLIDDWWWLFHHMISHIDEMTWRVWVKARVMCQVPTGVLTIMRQTAHKGFLILFEDGKHTSLYSHYLRCLLIFEALGSCTPNEIWWTQLNIKLLKR